MHLTDSNPHMQTAHEEQGSDLLQPDRDAQYQRDTNKQMLQLWCWWEKPEPFICQRPASERQHHLIPSPSIDVTTSICGQFALVISYPSSFWAPGPDFYFFSLLFVTMWHRWHIYPFNVSQMSNQPIAWQQFKAFNHVGMDQTRAV